MYEGGRGVRVMEHEDWFEGGVFQGPHVALGRLSCPAAADDAVDPAVGFFDGVREVVHRFLAEGAVDVVAEGSALVLVASEHGALV
jgi:hypothetical protein